MSALFTGKGDNGETGLFGTNTKIKKSSNTAEALGSLDEINSFLGLCKVRSKELGFSVEDRKFDQIVHDIQKTLFIIQAEIAGTDMTVGEEKIKDMESLINKIEKILPPIRTFFISGGTELAATFDIARTISRRAERRVVAVAEEGVVSVGQFSKAYMNRLSSILYAMARLSNHLSGINEEAPDYK